MSGREPRREGRLRLKRRLLSIAGAIGALSAVLVALTFFTGRLGAFLRALADEWHALKASENVNEMGSDVAHAAGIAWHALTLVSWPAWGALIFVVIVVPMAWHRLITAPRAVEKVRVINELAGRTTTRQREMAKAESDDA